MPTKRLLVLSLAFVLACKPPAPAEQMDSILSWIGTAAMAGDAWLRHTTPDTYTRQTLALSHEKLGQISDDLLKSPPSGTDGASLNAVLARTRKKGVPHRCAGCNPTTVGLDPRTAHQGISVHTPFLFALPGTVGGHGSE